MPSAFQVIADTTHLQFVPKDISFLSCQQRRCGCRCRNEQSNLSSSFHWQEYGLQFVCVQIRNSETDGWIFMLIAHGYTPFVLAVAAGVIYNLTATEIYSL